MQIRTQMSTKYIFIKFFPKIVSTRKFIGSKLKHCECDTTSIFQYKKSIMTRPEQKSGSNMTNVREVVSNKKFTTLGDSLSVHMTFKFKHALLVLC